MHVLTSACFSVAALTLLAAPAWADPPAAATTTAATADSEDSEARPPSFPVEFRGETLFRITAPIGSLKPARRAEEIARRLEGIASGPRAAADEVHAIEHDGRTNVVAGEQLILSVTDADAGPTGRTRAQLAADDAFVARGALQREFRDRSVKGLAFGALYTLMATVVLALFLAGMARAFPRIYRAFGRVSTRKPGSRASILVIGAVGEALVVVARIVRALVTAVVLYLYVNLTLSFFVWSRGLAQRLFGYLGSAALWMLHGVLGYLPNLVYIVIIFGATHYIAKFAKLLFEALHRGAFTISGFYADWAMPTFKIVRFLIFAFAAVLVFPYLPGSSSPAFRGISVFLGVLFSLGSASAVGNMIAGLVLTYMRPFLVGDRVKVAETVGDVVGKNLLVVRVRTIKQVEVTIPNAVVLANHIINYSTCAKDPGLILHATVTIGYDAPWRKIHELLLSAAAKTAGLLPTPTPFVLQTALDDFYVHYEINAYTDQPNEMVNIYSDLNARIQDAFNEAGMEIMSPHFAAARDGNRIAIPDPYLPKGYEAPAFRVTSVDPKKPKER